MPPRSQPNVEAAPIGSDTAIALAPVSGPRLQERASFGAVPQARRYAAADELIRDLDTPRQ